MLKALFNYLGVYQNSKRLTAEVEFEVAAHRVALQSRLRAFAISASLAAAAGLLLLIGMIFASIAIYELLADYVGRVGSLSAIACIYALVAVVLFVLSNNRAKKMPPARPLVLPQLFVNPPEPVVRSTQARTNYHSDNTDDAVLLWIKSYVVGLLPKQLDEPVVRAFMDAVTPQSEAAARDLFDKSLNTLKYGDRKSVFGVLVAGIFGGYILSQQSKKR